MPSSGHRIGIDARKLTDFGIGTYIRNLVDGLAEIDRHNTYFLFVGKDHAAELEHLPENFNTVVETAGVYSIRELFALSWRLWRLKLDLYHATHYVLPWIVPCRVVVTIHDIIHLLYPEFLPSRLAFLYAQRMMRRSLLRGDRIIANSRNTKTDLMDYFNVDGRKIRVIYHGVADRFRKRLAPDEVAAKLQELRLRQPYLLFVGNPKPHKNLDNVVKAYARALKLADLPADLVCIGDRTGRDFKIRQRVQQLGIEERVHLEGHLDEDLLPAVYQGASLFVYPTLYEGFGLPVVEAMASGVPVLTSNSSALKEIAGGHAQLVDPLNVEEIARAMVRCLTDEEYRTKLSTRGTRRAEEFQWRRTATETLDVYRKALGAEDPDETVSRVRRAR